MRVSRFRDFRQSTSFYHQTFYVLCNMSAIAVSTNANMNSGNEIRSRAKKKRSDQRPVLPNNLVAHKDHDAVSSNEEKVNRIIELIKTLA